MPGQNWPPEDDEEDWEEGEEEECDPNSDKQNYQGGTSGAKEVPRYCPSSAKEALKK